MSKDDLSPTQLFRLGFQSKTTERAEILHGADLEHWQAGQRAGWNAISVAETAYRRQIDQTTLHRRSADAPDRLTSCGIHWREGSFHICAATMAEELVIHAKATGMTPCYWCGARAKP